MNLLRQWAQFLGSVGAWLTVSLAKFTVTALQFSLVQQPLLLLGTSFSFLSLAGILFLTYQVFPELAQNSLAYLQPLHALGLVVAGLIEMIGTQIVIVLLTATAKTASRSQASVLILTVQPISFLSGTGIALAVFGLVCGLRIFPVTVGTFLYMAGLCLLFATVVVAVRLYQLQSAGE